MRASIKPTLKSEVTSRKVRLKSAKNLYLRYRFFVKIRQIHRFFYVFRQKLQILCRNQAHSRSSLPRTTRLARNPSTPSIYAQETRHPHEMDTGLKSLATCERTPHDLAHHLDQANNGTVAGRFFLDRHGVHKQAHQLDAATTLGKLTSLGRFLLIRDAKAATTI